MTCPGCRVLVSVLNWNDAHATLDCVNTLLRAGHAGCDVRIVVIDNGSHPDDAALLERELDPRAALWPQAANLGFTGGHNIAIRAALGQGYDYIWLVNSDAQAAPDALALLLAEMRTHPDCGAVSPVVVSRADPAHIAFCGNAHDWAQLDSLRARSVAEAEALRQAHPRDFWVAGTAVLFRVAALREAGELDAGLFAYYDDDDICLRLAARGWFSRTAYGALVRHVEPDDPSLRPPHYAYLMQRNRLVFWVRHTPPGYRRLLRLRLLDRAFYDVNRLYRHGRVRQAEAALLGIWDFLTGRDGAPRLERPVPWAMRLAQRGMRFMQRRHLAPAAG